MSDTAVDLDSLWSKDQASLSSSSRPPLSSSGRLELSSSGVFLGNSSTVSVSWRDLRYSVKGPKRSDPPTQLLHGVSGAVLPGEILAIMGGSGAGKSTLLDVLANRKSTGTIEGELLFNGVPASEIPTLLRRITGYVTQEDVFLASMTVRENLEFFALTTNDAAISSQEKKDFVTQLLKDLRLEHVADSRIGDTSKRGLSGGEKKRVAIAEQLLRNPKVLFLDEPTSGLDAFSSQQVMELLHSLAAKGMTIICSIHQPRSSIYDLFDKLLLLKKGKTVYMGPASQAVGYFASLGHALPSGFNPADFFIDVVLSSEEQNFAELFEQSELRKKVAESEAVARLRPEAGDLAEVQKTTNQFALPLWKQFSHVLKRNVVDAIRTPDAAMVNIIQSIVLGLIVGSIFYQLAPNAFFPKAGLMFFIVLSGAFPLTNIAVLLVLRRAVVNRERASGVYSILVYFLARTVVDSAICIILPILFNGIIYYMAGLNPDASAFFTLIGTTILNALVAGSLFTMVGALSPEPLVANVMSFVSAVIFMLFSQFLVSTPIWWTYIEHLSLFKYSWAALMNNQFGGTPEGTLFLAQFQIGQSNWSNFLAMALLFVGFRVFGFLGMLFVNTEKR